MKKLIAMVMTAAMVASLVPATAFAGDDIKATAKVVNSWTKKDSNSSIVVKNPSAPELQIRLNNVDAQGTDPVSKLEFSVQLDNATFADADDLVETVELKSDNEGWSSAPGSTEYKYKELSTDDLKAAMRTYWKNELASKSPKFERKDIYYGTLTANQVDAWLSSQQGTLVDDTVLSGWSVPSAGSLSGKSAEDNRTAAWTDWLAQGQQATTGLTGPSKTVNDNKASYAYGDWTAQGFGKGWYSFNAATGAEPFVAESLIIEFADDENQKVAGKYGLDGKDDVDGDATKFVDNRDEDADFDKWYNTASTGALAKINTGLASNKLYVESQRTVGATPDTGTFRSLSATVTPVGTDGDEIKLIVELGAGEYFEENDIISIDLLSNLKKVKSAYVSVDSDDVTFTSDSDDLVYVAVESEGITASIKKIANVAEEEHTKLSKDLVIKSTVEDFAAGQIIELKLNNGFEFTKACDSSKKDVYKLNKVDDDMLELEVVAATDKIEVAAGDIEIEATSAKEGATAVITVKATNKDGDDKVLAGAFNARATVEVMKVVDYTVTLTVDEDKDVPVIYNGVDVDNFGLTDDSDHWTLEVTAEETFPGAWSFRKGFNFELPEGVFVTDVEITDVDGFLKSSTADGKADVEINKDGMEKEFFDAYQDGDNVNFEFDKRVFDDVDAELAKDEATVSFKLQLVADPDFTGDVTLKLNGELVDEQEVVVAKFVAPFTVKAEQNDLIIDYRYTEVPTAITVTEAEAGLWDKDNAKFGFMVEKPDYIVFEDDPTYTVDKNSGMELDDAKLKTFDGNKEKGIYFVVDKESDEAATVTISDLKLFMQRNIPAGAYDLEAWTSMWDNYEAQQLFAPNCNHSTYAAHESDDCDELSFVGDVCDYSDTVKEAFVNVVTAGRDQDDASFTTKVVVPVGETKITAGEVEYTIDAPAYINANGYTMLPVRAVATALGIKNDNVLWDQATKTVTILYGQRIITMQVGASVVYVNGAAIPASSSVEITNNRTFLGLRDLATALGVTDITWDASTKTAILNGGNTAE